MPAITIQLPQMDAEQHVEVEVKINGQKKRYNYRVEIIAWESCEEPPEERAQCLKKVIENYNHDWQLVEIGSPTEKNIPVMFKLRTNPIMSSSSFRG
ncbi:MAG: hypothetical protein GY869_27940 [Planctomycetes bacterium]|nr:hypothetical protein [Planctomycetota bacterium]